MKKVFFIILSLFVAAVILFRIFLGTQYQAPILMYHQVKPDARYVNRLAVSVDTFRRQMSFLKRYGYNVVTLERLVDFISAGKRIPHNTVVVTFDDGYLNNYTHAFPVLKEYGIPATIFIITDEVGRAQGDRLSWDQIREMSSSGLISFGSHAMGPEPLVNIASRDEIKRQIFESKRIIEGRLGQPVKFFSYPEGKFNPFIRQTVIDAGYRGAVTTFLGSYHPNNDLFALKRLRVSERCANLFAFWAHASGFYAYFKERDKDERRKE
jgi:peptidoglycan/xylan/chitin deacetylase (PgdA/CDA1 family)